MIIGIKITFRVAHADPRLIKWLQLIILGPGEAAVQFVRKVQSVVREERLQEKRSGDGEWFTRQIVQRFAKYKLYSMLDQEKVT